MFGWAKTLGLRQGQKKVEKATKKVSQSGAFAINLSTFGNL
jgi:hypothetical protein